MDDPISKGSRFFPGRKQSGVSRRHDLSAHIPPLEQLAAFADELVEALSPTCCQLRDRLGEIGSGERCPRCTPEGRESARPVRPIATERRHHSRPVRDPLAPFRKRSDISGTLARLAGCVLPPRMDVRSGIGRRPGPPGPGLHLGVRGLPVTTYGPWSRPPRTVARARCAGRTHRVRGCSGSARRSARGSGARGRCPRGSARTCPARPGPPGGRREGARSVVTPRRNHKWPRARVRAHGSSEVAALKEVNPPETDPQQDFKPQRGPQHLSADATCCPPLRGFEARP